MGKVELSITEYNELVERSKLLEKLVEVSGPNPHSDTYKEEQNTYGTTLYVRFKDSVKARSILKELILADYPDCEERGFVLADNPYGGSVEVFHRGGITKE